MALVLVNSVGATVSCGSVAVKIWGNPEVPQDAQWNLVNDTQYSSYGFLLTQDIALSYVLQESGDAPTRIELDYPIVVNPWILVPDAQSPNWQQVNDTQ